MSENNMIEALLQHDLDEIAIENMGHYHFDMNEDLLLYCLENSDGPFLFKALQLQAFDGYLFL